MGGDIIQWILSAAGVYGPKPHTPQCVISNHLINRLNTWLFT